MKIQSFITGVIVAVALVGPLAAFAQTTTSASAVTTGSATSPVIARYRVCSVLNRNLSLGQRGDDVQALQEYLIGEGILKVSATGYFGAITRSAVMQWQTGNDVHSIGSFGPLSRARVKSRCGNVNTNFSADSQKGQAPLSVTFTTSIGINDTLPSVSFGDGQQDTMTKGSCIGIAAIVGGQGGIRCSATVSHVYTQNGTYVAHLMQTFFDPEIGVRSSGELTIVVGDTDSHNALSADPQSGNAPLQVAFTYRPDRDNGVYWIDYGDGEGQLMNIHPIYCIRAPCVSPVGTSHAYTVAGTYTATVTAYIACMHSNPRCMIATMPLAQTIVTVTGGASNGTPAISQFSGPVTLAANEVGTWKITASDPENGTLNYSIVWGDEWTASNASAKMIAPSEGIQQNTTFTHSYTNPGTYTVALTVTDATGLSARATASVQVSQTMCTADYTPVCGRPTGCVNTCAAGHLCSAICQLPSPTTYSNRCQMNNSSATFMHDGVCTGNEGYLQ